MADQHDLDTRVADLERIVSDLQRDIHEMRAALHPNVAPTIPIGGLPTGPVAIPASLATPVPLPPPPLPPPPLPKRPVGSAEIVRGSEYWFSRIGIGLLLLGLAFLFKYAIDQGWLTPVVRVCIGMFAGGVLLTFGLRLRRSMSAFGQVLQGGGIAALYMSDFAAFQFYELVSYPLAFGCMCFITILTFGLAVWQSSLALAVIAALGGLGTPFLLFTDTGSAVGLVSYTALVLSSIAATCLYRAWRPLLWVGVVGGWLILLIALLNLPSLPAGRADHWAVTLGTIWTGMLFWSVLVLLLFRKTPVAGIGALNATDLIVFTIHMPFVALALIADTWNLEQAPTGWLALIFAGIAALGAWLFWQREGLQRVGYAHAFTAILLLTTALVLILDGNLRICALAVEGAILHVVAGRRRDAVVATLAHVLFAGLVCVVLLRIVFDTTLAPIFLNPDALTNLVVIGLAFGASWMLYPRAGAPAYWLVAHLLLLGLLAHGLGSLPNGNGYITMAWGVYGIALLAIGLRIDKAIVSLFGLGTLLLVVAKLFLVDLADLATIWRTLLFMGFGGAFLILGYFVRSFWRPRTTTVPPTGVDDSA